MLTEQLRAVQASSADRWGRLLQRLCWTQRQRPVQLRLLCKAVETGSTVPLRCPTPRQQEERNACLAAATRADALLSKLGQHALLTRGVD